MDNKKFKFTQEDLDAMVLGALNEQPVQGGLQKPNAIQTLLTQAQLGKGGQVAPGGVAQPLPGSTKGVGQPQG